MDKYYKVQLVVCKKFLRGLLRKKQKVTTIHISDSPKKLVYLEMEEFVLNKGNGKYILEDIIVEELLY